MLVVCALSALGSWLGGLGGCAPSSQTTGGGRSGRSRAPLHRDGKDATVEFLRDNEDRYRAAVARAKRWLDGLEVDPVALSKAGIKGKKKLVELLDAYVRLHSVASPKQKRKIVDRVRSAVEVTYADEYHDMAQVDDRRFKQESTSYLRAALLMEKLGLDTERYRAEIRKIHPRLNQHMIERGSHQRMAFHWYYSHFGLKEPFNLAIGFKAGVVASRLDPYEYRSKLRVYQLTHEIFIPYRYGAKLDADYFSEEDKRYLRRTLDRLAVHYLMERDPDLAGELITCIRYLAMTDLPVYREGLDYLLGSQRPDGKWGAYERYRRRYGEMVDQALYLHTTGVVLDALIVAFGSPGRISDGRSGL
jgi:hypothetical protein